MINRRLQRVAVHAAAALTLIASPLFAHELGETGATVIVRDGGHVELRLNVPWSTVLRAKHMPRQPLNEVLTRLANAPASEFARDIAAVEREVEQATALATTGAGHAFTRWSWPASSVIQEALKRELMSRLVEGERYEHASRLPAAAELKLASAPRAIRMKFPAVLGAVLLTVTVPQQAWLQPGAWSRDTRTAPPQ